MKLLLFAVALLLPIGCFATDRNLNYKPYVLKGYASCGKYLEARAKCKKGNCMKANYFNQWLDGYLTAFDEVEPNTVDIAAGQDLYSLDLWLENYCKRHPLKPIYDATKQLVITLLPTRLKAAPKEGK